MSKLQGEFYLRSDSDQQIPIRSTAREKVQSHSRNGRGLQQARDRRRAACCGYQAHVRVTDEEGLVLLPFGRRRTDVPRVRAWHLAVQRAMDLAVGTVLVIAAAPLLAVVACAVALTSDGPVLFRQERVGRHGKPFMILKFRTMQVGVHEGVRASGEFHDFVTNDFKLRPGDRRITPIGRFLRRTSLDELPQLINVLRGEMSIVGIRPLVPEELRLRPPIDQFLYCRLRPGMTGLWQVSGRSHVKREMRIAMDREYAARWKPGMDVAIMCRTPRTVLRSRETA